MEIEVITQFTRSCHNNTANKKKDPNETTTGEGGSLRVLGHKIWTSPVFDLKHALRELCLDPIYWVYAF